MIHSGMIIIHPSGPVSTSDIMDWVGITGLLITIPIGTGIIMIPISMADIIHRTLIILPIIMVDITGITGIPLQSMVQPIREVSITDRD